MAIKYTIQGLLIYATIAAYLFVFALMLIRRKKSAHTLFAVGFLVGCAAIAYRWFDVRHIPMQNLFEVFLVLGALVYPISVFCNRVLRIGAVAADILIGVLVLFPAGFIFNAEPQQLPPALQSWLFGPHVFVYILSYVLMTKAAVQAIITWHGLPRGTGFQPVKNSTDIPQTANRKNYSISFSAFSAPAPCSFSEAGGSAVNKRLPPEDATYRMVCAGFPLLTLGLILGSVWGQSAWGDWWGWDPKELWSLASWLIYLGYFHFRYMFAKKFPRLNSAWVILGLIVIIITLLWVNLSRLFPGLHSYAM